MARIYEVDDEQAYEDEVGQCVRVTGYHHWFFLSAMAEALDLTFRAFVVESGGERLGVVPVLFRRRGPLSTVNVLPIGYVGPLVRGDTLRAGRLAELVLAVEPVLRRQLTVVTRWGFSPGLNVSAEELGESGFEVFNSDNYVIPGTRSLDDCLKAMARKRRQSIRHNEVLGLYATDSSGEEITGWLPQQVVEVFKRQGSPSLYPLAALQSITRTLATHPRMRWRTVKQADGKVVGMTASIISDDRLWFWLIGGTPSPGVSPQTLCYWDMIQSSVSIGLTLDSGGAPTEEIRKFKTSIGAELETFTTAIRMRPKGAYKLGQALYNRTLGWRA
jgi:CelD/BcsL family acetyltransferase involved in cellulose biosynthesis